MPCARSDHVNIVINKSVNAECTSISLNCVQDVAASANKIAIECKKKSVAKVHPKGPCTKFNV